MSTGSITAACGRHCDDNRPMSTTSRRRRRAKANAPAEAAVGTAEEIAAEGMLGTVAEICGFENRLAGTDAERRAASHVAARLRESGREAEAEPIHVHPQVALVHALHCTLGFAGSLLTVVSAPVGFVVALIAATSMYLDLNGRLYLLRLLFFRRATQNVVSPSSNPEAPARLLIVANLDTARTGAFFDAKRMRRNERIGRLLPVPYGPYRILFWALASLLPLLGLRMAGVDSGVVSTLQLIPTLSLLIGIFALVDVELSDPVPGANANASGVAVAIDLGAELQRNPPANLDPWVVITSGGECSGEGMRAFLRANRTQFDRDGTFVLNLMAVGRGELRYVVSEGLAVSFDMDRRLVELCAALAGEQDQPNTDDQSSSEPAKPRALPLRTGFADDALPARIARLRPISLTALAPGGIVAPDYRTAADTPQRVEAQALEHARDFSLELIAAIDRDVGRAQARSGD